MRKKIVSVLLCVLLLMVMLPGCGSNTDTTEDTNKKSEETTDSQESQKSDNDSADTLTGKVHAEIDIQDYGVIQLELDADTAPITVNNFVKLAKEGFYDGLTFHRIISGFMIQGGCPLGNGTGGADETIKGEFNSNGVENNISHVRGVISMARSMENDSASSQFFIVHEDSAALDGQYAAFGMVTSGMEVVDAICDAVPVEDDNGTVLPENQPVINHITITD
ncbi:MAG: peptidylprolyl isomerase [Lachnospiraceae bacterium]|nr:peptidylprolyl isomerase [Lachnospiraceae bacterium]